MAEYLHGIYGESLPSNFTSTSTIGTLPVYVGTLPVHRINKSGAKEFDYKNYVNKPILINSYKDVANLGIYSNDWETYTLAEALYVHFMNGDSVAPVVLINFLDPETNKGSEQTTATITLAKEGKSLVGYINDPLCCIDDIALTADGVTFNDGEVEYLYESDTVKIIITKADFDKTTISASYLPISIEVESITTSTFQKAVDAIEDVEMATGLVPTILAAPKLSKVPELHDVMIQKAIEKAAMKWNFICVTDIAGSSIDEAIEWKKDNQYNSKLEKACWLSAGIGDKIVCGSTIWAFTMQMTDFNNGETPHKSPSNEIVNIDRTVLEDGTVVFIKEYQANKLNEVGISTFNLVKKQFRTWGSHMANYDFNKLDTIKPEEKFDAQIRMNHYLLNYLQYHYINEIDQSFKKSDIDSIVNSVQTWLDGLVNDGKLLYAKVSFDSASNPIEQIENGDLVFDFEVTYAITTKSITFRLQYTRAGIVALLEGGGSNE